MSTHDQNSKIQSSHSCASCCTLCVWLPGIHALSVNEHLNASNDELHFSPAGLRFPFQKHFQVRAPQRSVRPGPNTCIKLTGHPSSKTLFFLSLFTFLKLHPLTHISSETVLSTGSHCLLLKEAFWPSHDKIENQTNPTVMLSKWSESVYGFYRHQPCASGCQHPD